MSKIRISIGSASCKDIENKGSFEKSVCEGIYRRLNEIKSTSYANLNKRSDNDTDFEKIDGREIVYAVYKEVLDEGTVLFVVQALFKTLRFPNYFSFNFIGKVVVEGILATSSGEFKPPSDDILLNYK